jgi:hypothetical protein
VALTYVKNTIGEPLDTGSKSAAQRRGYRQTLRTSRQRA